MISALMISAFRRRREIKHIEEELLDVSEMFKLDVNLDDDIVRRIK